ncbi:MAG TPA: hypothetical protein VKH17_06820 [Acidimicrobiia bacterium]|nr:hypothetical protein [Acidimicrobiia bacterium]
MRRLPPLVIALALVLALWDNAAVATDRRDLAAYQGLGTWVDVYEYVPALQKAHRKPPVTPSDVDKMKDHGVKTLYLQSAQDDSRTPGATVTPKLLGQFLQRAHDAGLRVVAWYLPHFDDLDADLRHIRGLLDFRSGGERFDGVALDIEFRGDVSDAAVRSDALVDLSRRVRQLARNRPIGAIVLEPVLLEVVNANFWPDFPWRRIAGLYDVWLPMSYWTNRTAGSVYRDSFRYTDENIRRLRANLGQSDAPVHAIGGLGNAASIQDYAGFVRAARAQRAIGWSIYNYGVTPRNAWSRVGGKN